MRSGEALGTKPVRPLGSATMPPGRKIVSAKFSFPPGGCPKAITDANRTTVRTAAYRLPDMGPSPVVIAVEGSLNRQSFPPNAPPQKLSTERIHLLISEAEEWFGGVALREAQSLLDPFVYDDPTLR